MAGYAKLKNGKWGLRGTPEELVPGVLVTVTTKDGKQRTATVGRVLWHGDGAVLATIAGGGAGGPRRVRLSVPGLRVPGLRGGSYCNG